MNKLFALNNIEIQEMVDEDGLDISIAYTDDLLEKNVLVEFYEAALEEESETAVFVISCDKVRSYTFTLYVVNDFIKPLQIFRLVCDAIDFIKSCNKETLFADLAEISTGVSTSDELEDKNDSKRVFKQDSWKFKTAMELIEGSRRSKKS